MTNRLINRLFFITPGLVLAGLHFYNSVSIGFVDKSDVIMIILASLFLLWLTYEIKNNLRYFNRRKKAIHQPQLHEPKAVKNRENYFNLKLREKDRELDVFDESSIVFHLNKANKKIEIIGNFKNRKFSVNKIKYLVGEFTDRFLFTFNHDWGKTYWTCKYFVKLKNSDKLVILFKMQANRDNLYEMDNDKRLDNTEYYFLHGLEILNLLSANLRVNYTIVNQNKKLDIETIKNK